MSTNFWKIFGTAAAPLGHSTYAGGKLESARFRLGASAVHGHLQAREISWHLPVCQAYLVATDSSGRTRIVPVIKLALGNILPTPQLLAAVMALHSCTAGTCRRCWLAGHGGTLR
jgi:hypothetical protein